MTTGENRQIFTTTDRTTFYILITNLNFFFIIIFEKLEKCIINIRVSILLQGLGCL